MSPLPSPSDSVWLATLSPAERDELVLHRSEITHSRPDVLVVGGGIVGLAAAYFLAERGASVQSIEAKSLAAAASGANAGGIWPNDQAPSYAPAFQSLAFQSRDLWARLSLRPNFDFDWRVNGLLNLNSVCVGPSAIETAERLQTQGLAVQAVDGDQIAGLEPQLRSGLSSGLHLPSEAHVHPVRACLSLARGAAKSGAGIAIGVTAREARGRNGKLIAVETTAGPIEPRHVISATGWSTAWLTDVAAPLPPLRPVSGQLISTDPLPPLLRSAVVGQFLVVQLKSGEIITGGNADESNRVEPDNALSERFINAARELIPALGNVPFTRAWCGLRPATPDGLPVIDRVDGVENLWLASGHFKNGVLLAPATGILLADWIVTGKKPDELDAYRANRFAPSAGLPLRP